MIRQNNNEYILNETDKLRFAIRDFLLRLKYLVIGITFIIGGISFCIAAFKSTGSFNISTDVLYLFFGFILTGFVFILLEEIFCRIFQKKLQLKPGNTMGYEEDAEVFSQLSPREIKKQSFLFYSPMYLLLIVEILFLIFKTGEIMFFQLICGIGLIGVMGTFGLYLAFTGKFYLKPDFQPKKKKTPDLKGAEKQYASH